jgi:hypothetical protein
MLDAPIGNGLWRKRGEYWDGARAEFSNKIIRGSAPASELSY